MAANWYKMLETNRSESTSPPPMRDLLATFVPGYGALFTLLEQAFGIDISLIISFCAVLFAVLKFWSFLQEQTHRIASSTILSEITFDSDDEIYSWLMEWLKTQPLAGRKLVAKAGVSHENWRGGSSKKTTLREAPEIAYEPSLGTHYFWFQRRLYRFSQWIPRDRQESIFLRPGVKRVDASLSCLGRSAKPIRELLRATAVLHFEKMSSKTSIYRPFPKQIRQNGRGYWSEVSSRPSRSMDTVIFDSELKNKIVDDMDEYLAAETMTWYADHGIPYRRGYLFFGPPGTGKSSLCFALAGHFKLPLYCLSLQEPSMTEEDLAALFDALPRQCVAVLEDVDCAGIIREVDEKSKGTPITLAGLLNIIDGVASKEGRVLIMTTNRVDVLDAALIRPGRVDLKIEFKPATKDDIQRLFDALYDLQNSDMGRDFAEAIPEAVFSPAEIQGFLLTRKGKPKTALADVAGWVEEQLQAREDAKKKAEEDTRKKADDAVKKENEKPASKADDEEAQSDVDVKNEVTSTSSGKTRSRSGNRSNRRSRRHMNKTEEAE